MYKLDILACTSLTLKLTLLQLPFTFRCAKGRTRGGSNSRRIARARRLQLEIPAASPAVALHTTSGKYATSVRNGAACDVSYETILAG